MCKVRNVAAWEADWEGNLAMWSQLNILGQTVITDSAESLQIK